MATPKTTPDDAGCVVLVVPFGKTRSRRLIVPHEVAIWLRDELCQAIPDPAAPTPRPRRQVRLHRGRWLSGAGPLSSTF